MYFSYTQPGTWNLEVGLQTQLKLIQSIHPPPLHLHQQITFSDGNGTSCITQYANVTPQCLIGAEYAEASLSNEL